MNGGDDAGVGQNGAVKTCQYGHHYYTGNTCPLCDYLGRDNLARVYDER